MKNLSNKYSGNWMRKFLPVCFPALPYSVLNMNISLTVLQMRFYLKIHFTELSQKKNKNVKNMPPSKNIPLHTSSLPATRPFNKLMDVWAGSRALCKEMHLFLIILNFYCEKFWG